VKRIAILIVMLLAGGCATSAQTPASVSATTQPHAECLVCKHNADLACIDVTVDSQTPHCVCNGQTYYFCSDECRRAFEKNPAKYLSHGN
jgi:YHS domain-containing protein